MTEVEGRTAVVSAGVEDGEFGEAMAAVSAAQRPASRRLRERIAVDGGLVGFLAAMIVAFAFILPSQFPTFANAQNVLGSEAIPAMLALAVIVPLTAGEFDLSVGANLGVSAVASAYAASHGVGPLLTFLIAMGMGAAIGVFNGLLVTRVRISAFIGTLGVATILSGGNLIMTKGTVIFENIGPSFTDIARTSVLGLPIVVFYALGVAIVLWYFMEWAPFGRYVRATGSAREAARLSGVRTDRCLFLSFVIAGLIAGLAGYMNASRTASASPSIGPEFLLPAYAAAFLGATTIHSGRFNVWGTIIGVLVLAVGINGLSLAGVAEWVPPVFNGGALIISVSFATIVARRHRSSSA